MISIIVQTPPADFQGPDISDPMIITEAMALARGRSEIRANHEDRKKISGSSALTAYMRPGSIILYTDRAGVQHRCLLTRSSCTIDRPSANEFSATTDIDIEYQTERRR